MSTKIRIHELGPHRWHMSVRFNNDDGSVKWEVKTWMADNYPDCLCIHRWNGGEPYWELRGGNEMDQAFIAMRWGGEQS